MLSKIERDKDGNYFVRISKAEAEKILKLLPSDVVRVDLSIPFLLEEVLKNEKQ